MNGGSPSPRGGHSSDFALSFLRAAPHILSCHDRVSAAAASSDNFGFPFPVLVLKRLCACVASAGWDRRLRSGLKSKMDFGKVADRGRVVDKARELLLWDTFGTAALQHCGDDATGAWAWFGLKKESSDCVRRNRSSLWEGTGGRSERCMAMMSK